MVAKKLKEIQLSNAQNPLHTFPRNFPILLATSRCNGISEMTQHNRLLPVPTCYRLVADLLWGSRQLVTGKLV